MELVPEPNQPAVDAANFVSLRMRFKCDSREYPARLVNLPTLVETHKTFDTATFYKCGDIAQMVLVYATEDDRRNDERRASKWSAWRTSYPDGLAPPLRDVVARRFSRARKQARVDYSHDEVANVEQQMQELVRTDGALPEQELLCEDIVPCEDWMLPPGAAVNSISEDATIALRHPWILAPAAPDAPAPTAAPPLVSGRASPSSSDA